MQFSEITKSVQDAWNFSWPPVLMCIILYALVRFIIPSKKNTLSALIDLTLSHAGTMENARRALDPYGLSKLVPFVSLILVITVFYILNSVILLNCQYIPPHLDVREDVFAWKRFPVDKKILIYRSHPTAKSWNAAYYDAARKSKAFDIDDDRRSPYFRTEYFIKYTAIICAIILVFGVRRSGFSFKILGKGALVLAACALAWFANLLLLLFEEQQVIYTQGDTIQSYLLEKRPGIMTDPEPSEAEKRLLREHIGERWWSIQFIDFVKYQMIFHELSPSALETHTPYVSVDLKDSIDRLADIQYLKNERMIGEGHDGLLFAVDSSNSEYSKHIYSVIGAENELRMKTMKEQADIQQVSLNAIQESAGEQRRQLSFKGELIEVPNRGGSWDRVPKND